MELTVGQGAELMEEEGPELMVGQGAELMVEQETALTVAQGVGLRAELGAEPLLGSVWKATLLTCGGDVEEVEEEEEEGEEIEQGVEFWAGS